MPWEWTEPLVQWEKSKESWYGGSSSYNTAAQDTGSSYPAQLSFVCWSHCFYPDWMKSQALFCLALLMVLDKRWGETVTGTCQQRQNTKKSSTFSSVNHTLLASMSTEIKKKMSDYKNTSAIPSSVMMGIFAPVVTEVCLTNPWTGLFSGEDLSIPGGVKP